MDPFAPEGILPNVLRFADRPGQVVRNVLKGRPGAAGRQALDFLGEGIDAFIPGDLFPAATKREDYVSGSELIGLDPGTSGIGRTVADIGVGLATDPLTYLTFGASAAAKAGQAAKYGVGVGIPFAGKTTQYLPGLDNFAKPVDPLSLAGRLVDRGISGTLGAGDRVLGSPTIAGKQTGKLSEGYDDLKATVRRAAGAEDLGAGTRTALDLAGGEGAQAARVYATQAEQLLKGVPEDERVLLTKAFLGVDLGSLKAKKAGQASVVPGDLQGRVLELSRRYGKDAAKMTALADEVVAIGKRQWDEGLQRGVFEKPITGYQVGDAVKRPGELRADYDKIVQGSSPDALRAAGLDSYQKFLKNAGATPIRGEGGVPDYLQRQWILGGEEGANGAIVNALKERKLDSPEQIAQFFNTGKVGLELDSAKLLLDRATQQGAILERANIAKEYGGLGNSLEDLKKSAKESIAARTDLNADEIRRINQTLDGMPSRGGFGRSLAGVNKHIKGAMVYGVVLPKVGSMVRNKLGMGFQALATPGARKEALEHLNPKNVVDEMSRAFDEAYGEVIHGSKSWARGDELGKDITLLDQAYAAAKNTDDVGAFLRAQGRDDLAEAVRHGVTEGYVSTEELVRRIGADPDKRKWLDLYHAPGVMFQTMEQRARLQTFKNLIKGKNEPATNPANAARLTKEAFYDYKISSPENRAFRDVIPFGQFMAKAIPQQAKLLSTKPAAAVGLAPLFYDPSGDNAPTYPYLQGKTKVGVGEDDKGNQLYLSGFGLPVEAISSLPNPSGSMSEFGRGLSQGALASTQPLLKTAAAVTTGRDPYFGTPFGSYSKLPIVGEAGNVGRATNVFLGTGLGEPLGAGVVRQIGQATDSSKPGFARALDIGTGAKLTSVDADVAEQQVLTRYLESRPEVRQYRTFYQPEPDEEFSDLLQQLSDAKARVKAKRQAAAASF